MPGAGSGRPGDCREPTGSVRAGDGRRTEVAGGGSRTEAGEDGSRAEAGDRRELAGGRTAKPYGSSRANVGEPGNNGKAVAVLERMIGIATKVPYIFCFHGRLGGTATF